MHGVTMKKISTNCIDDDGDDDNNNNNKPPENSLVITLIRIMGNPYKIRPRV